MDNKRNLVAGSVLILIGMLFLFGIGNLWSVVLLAFGLYLIVRRHLVGGFFFTVLGALLLGSAYLDEDLMSKYWPLIIIAMGLALLLENFLKKDTAELETDSDPDISVFMGELNKKIISDNFVGAKIEVVMGSAKLDLREAKIGKSGAKIDVTTVLGEAELTIARDIKVVTTGTPILAEWKNDFNQEMKENAPTLTISGEAVLGSVKIRN